MVFQLPKRLGIQLIQTEGNLDKPSGQQHRVGSRTEIRFLFE